MKKKSVVIFGAADTGVATQRVLENHGGNNIHIVAFIDDDKKKSNKNLNGIPVIRFEEFVKIAALQPIDELVIASFTIPTRRKNELVDFINYKWNQKRFFVVQDKISAVKLIKKLIKKGF
jgi:FlaA1/EpsC-like NDP-sugar epimerase